MRRFCTSLIAAALLATGTAHAAEPQPLRTLVYDVNSAAHCITNDFGDEHGTMTVAVVAAPAGGGLVADVTYRVDSKVSPAVRVAIFPDGQISYWTFLCAPAAWAMKSLAIGFVSDGGIAVGHTWHLPGPRNPGYGDSWYRVEQIDGTRATFSIYDWRAHDTRSIRGTMTYATDVKVPVSVEIEGRVNARLVSDTPVKGT